MNEGWLKFCDAYGLAVLDTPTDLVLIHSSQPNVNERLADCETCGFSVRWVWSEYDRAFLSSMNWRAE